MEETYQNRFKNRVQDRLKDCLKKQIMQTVLSEGYFYLERQDFVETFQELITEINK